MKDDISQVKLFMKFLDQMINTTIDTGELKGIEDAALEIFYRARAYRRNIEINQKQEQDE